MLCLTPSRYLEFGDILVSSNFFHFFQFLPEETGRNSYFPVSSGRPGRNTFLPEETQPCKDIFEASFLLLSYYPKPVSKKIANTFNWKTTHYSWLKQLLNPLPSPFHLYGGNFLPPLLMAIALFQHINHCNFSRSPEISLKFSVSITDPQRSWIMWKKIYSNRMSRQSFGRLRYPNPEWILSLLL